MILENYAKEVDKLLAEFFKQKKAESSAHVLPDFGMLNRVEEFCLRGGKRLRSALVHFGYSLFNGAKNQEVIKLSVIMELVHAYLLIHDDFMDESDLRRGRPTVHKQYEKECQGKHLGESLAILAGDLAQCLSLEVLNQSSFPDNLKNEVLHKINQSVQTTILGQELDLRLEAKRFSSVSEILEMYKWKTAKYTFECPLQIGLILAGARNADHELISRYSLPTGILFQIKDDILGLLGDEEKTGKSVLDDLRRGKQTILVAKALELASPEDKIFIEGSLGRVDLGAREAEAIREIIKNNGALLFAQNLMRQKMDEAKFAVREMREKEYNKEAADFLEGLVDFIVEREN